MEFFSSWMAMVMGVFNGLAFLTIFCYSKQFYSKNPEWDEFSPPKSVIEKEKPDPNLTQEKGSIKRNDYMQLKEL